MICRFHLSSLWENSESLYFQLHADKIDKCVENDNESNVEEGKKIMLPDNTLGDNVSSIISMSRTTINRCFKHIAGTLMNNKRHRWKQ